MRIRILFLAFVIFISINAGFAYDFISKKLPSGQIVVVHEQKDNPVVTINTWVKTGSINETETNTGVAHFLEHLFFKGSKNVPTGEFDKILESKGAVTNAATSKDYTQFYITIPSKDFDLALKLHSDMLLNPLVPRKELEKERAVVIEEIGRGLDNPANVMYNNLFKAVYEHPDTPHPYFRPVIGTKEVISTITREEIMDFYNNWYTPNNMITVVSGDVDANYAIGEIEKAFSRPPVKTVSKNDFKIKPLNDKKRVVEKKDVTQGYVAIAFKAPKFTDKKETYALDVLSAIMGGSQSSILYRELKEKKRLVNSIGTSYSQYKDDGLFIVSSTFEPKKQKEVEEQIYAEIEKIRNGGITKQEIQKAKNMIKTSTYYGRESVQNIAEELGYFTLYFGCPSMYDDYLKRIDEVNLKDVLLAANKFLNPDKTVTSLLLPTGFVEVSDVKNESKIDSKPPLLVEDTGTVKKYTLNNGTTLIIRKTKSNSILAFYIQGKGGYYTAPDPSLPYLAASLVKRGIKSFTQEELNNYLDENGIRLNLGTNPDGLNLSLQATKDKEDDAFFVLDEIINHPTYPDSERVKIVKDYKDYVKSLKDRPLALVLDKLTGLGFKGSPYGNNSDVLLKTIDNVKVDSISDYYSKAFDSKNVVVTVTGDVDEQKMIDKFSSIFKDKGQQKISLKGFYKKPYIPEQNVQEKLKNDGKETSWILLAYKTSPIYDIKENATLRVINSLMGSGMSSRMFTSLREEKGLAYQVGTQIRQHANDSMLISYIGTNFQKEQVALEGMENEFNKIRTEYVPLKELEEAKEKLLGNLIISFESNMDFSSFLGNYTALGFDLDYLDKLKEAIKTVTPLDVMTFANKYFSNPYFVVIAGK